MQYSLTTTVRHRLDELAEAADAVISDYSDELLGVAPMAESRSRAALQRCAAWLVEASAVMDLAGPGIWVLRNGRYTTLGRMQRAILRIATQVVRHRESMAICSAS